MKKLGMGMETSGWLVSMFPILKAKCEENVTKSAKCCESDEVSAQYLDNRPRDTD